MDKGKVANSFKLDDKSTSDIIVRLRNKEGRREVFYSHSFVLKNKSKFFADRLCNPNSDTCIDINCSDFNYNNLVDLLCRLYLPSDLLLESWDSVKSAVGILQVAVAFHCEEITQSCIQYLEAVPWEDKEEEEILKAVSKLGSIAMPILARIQPVDLSNTKNVLLSAIRFATSISGPCPPFGDELKTSAQEQVEYMLGEDEETPLVTGDDEIRVEMRMGLSKICSSFEKELSSLLLESDLTSETAENKIIQCLSDLEWMCNILPKIDLMKDFVAKWAEISGNILGVVEDKKLDSFMWGSKVKLIEVTAKVLEAVGYGNVIIPAPCRVLLLKTWLPYIRKIKPLLDSKGNEDAGFPYKMDEDLCQSIEGAIVSLVLALPSNDQADILTDWMKAEQVKYPDLSEAFEVWCYRTKSAKRRLMEGLDRVGNATVSL
ncbi:BTB/POZ domain-containing protein At3g05675 isoform X2 [Cornus florida]|uniref:BTB/POZ domain-containing protein At3g05675 isoform X2 n=1 Tax=Cornus florida TaxID=4283 RepID=UPI00289A6D69|nr:BTB/POZ domain-containing protein At3g05675 isoform X2 [Cornus florida]